MIGWTIKDVNRACRWEQSVIPASLGGPTTAILNSMAARCVQVNGGANGIPESVKLIVDANPSEHRPAPATAAGYYRPLRSRAVPATQPHRAAVFALFLLVLYLTGKFMAAGLGRLRPAEGRKRGRADADRP